MKLIIANLSIVVFIVNFILGMSQKQDVICISHREDPDGIVSAVLLKNLFQAEIHLVDYDDFLIEFEKIIQNKI
jgi:hypothetical protein